MVSRENIVTFQAFEAYLQQPANADRLFELFNGEIIEKVPTEEHGIIVLNIAAPLRMFVKQHKLGRVTTESLHRVPADEQNAVLPDVSFRRDLQSPLVREGAIPAMPDLAVEVQSPTQSDDFMIEKAAYYLANGTQIVWLVFPTKRVVEVHQRDQVTTLTQSDMLTGGSVLPGFTLAVKDVFDID